MWGQITDKQSMTRYLFVKKFIEYDPQMSKKFCGFYFFKAQKREKQLFENVLNY